VTAEGISCKTEWRNCLYT